MSRVSTPQTRRLGQGMVYVDRQATRPWEAVESRHNYVAMSAGPSGKTELSREMFTAAGSRDSRYDRVALPGTTRHWAQEAEEACRQV